MLDDLARKLSLITNNRVLGFYAHSTADDVETAEFPVTIVDIEDRKETFVRQVAADFVRTKKKGYRADARFEMLPPGTWFTPPHGPQVQVMGKIVVRWWPKPPDEDYYGQKPSNSRS